jgi:hypothetical protein
MSRVRGWVWGPPGACGGARLAARGDRSPARRPAKPRQDGVPARCRAGGSVTASRRDSWVLSVGVRLGSGGGRPRSVALLCPPSLDDDWESRRANDNYGLALPAHPGEAQGRPLANTGSRPIEQHRPARPCLLPDAHVPDGRTVLTRPDATGIEAVRGHRAHLGLLIPVTTRSRARSPPSGSARASQRAPARRPPRSRWPTSCSPQPRRAGGGSTATTSSPTCSTA